jgi:transposase
MRRFEYNSRGVRKLIKYLTSLNPFIVSMEYTAGLERNLIFALQQHNIPCCCINPYNLKNFTKTMNVRAKTDLISAKLIAQYTKLYKTSPMQKIDKNLIYLKDLVKRHIQLVNILSSEKNRLSGSSLNKKHIMKFIKGVEKSIDENYEEIKKMVESNNEIKKKAELLKTMPGVGEYSSIVLAILLPELGYTTRRQISSLCGVAPYVNQSGKYKSKSYIRGGRKDVRNLVYMVTIAAIRHNPPIREYYYSLISKGKPKKVAIVACMRKVICILNAMVRDNKVFMADYNKLQKEENKNDRKIIEKVENQEKQNENIKQSEPLDFNKNLKDVVLVVKSDPNMVT